MSEDDGPNAPAQATLKYYDTWILNDHELPWLIDTDGKLVYYKYAAYFVYLLILDCQ